MKIKTSSKIDQILLISILCIVVLGLVNLYSATRVDSTYFHYNKYYFLIKQSIFTSLGFLIAYMITTLRIDQLRSISSYLIYYSLIALGLEYAPFVGQTIGGANRWLNFGYVYIMPSYFAQFACVLYLSKILSDDNVHYNRFRNVIVNFLPCILVLILILSEPSLSEAFVLLFVAFCMVYISGLKKLLYLTSIIFVSIFTMSLVPVMLYHYQHQRVISFLHPSKDPLGHGYQILQSLIYSGSGGPFGLGYDRGLAKYKYVPSIGSDFVLVNLMEEFGFAGFLALVLLLCIVMYRIIGIVRTTQSPYHKLLVFGASSLLFLKMLTNAGTVLGLLPILHLGFPYFSYGGSAQIVNFAIIGVILLVSREAGPYPNYLSLIFQKLESASTRFNHLIDTLKRHPIVMVLIFLFSMCIYFLKFILDIIKAKSLP
jgi:cell division protein FtsW (lipid II flippase)